MTLQEIAIYAYQEYQNSEEEGIRQATLTKIQQLFGLGQFTRESAEDMLMKHANEVIWHRETRIMWIDAMPFNLAGEVLCLVGECSQCHMRDRSDGLTSLKDLGEVLVNFRPRKDHECPR